MFEKMLREKLGKVSFAFFFTGFHLTFFVQHFLGLMGMPRRVWTILPGQGLETGNLVSSVGAGFMAIGVFILLINIVITKMKNVQVGRDPWKDGRTLKWSILNSIASTIL